MVQSSLQSSKNNGVENKKNDSFPKGPNLKRKKIEGPPASETRQEGGSRQGQERQAAFHEDLLQEDSGAQTRSVSPQSMTEGFC